MSLEMDHNNQLANNFKINPTGNMMEFTLPNVQSPDRMTTNALSDLFSSFLNQRPFGSVKIYLSFPSVEVDTDGNRSINERRVIYNNKKPVISDIATPTSQDFSTHFEGLARSIAIQAEGTSKIEITRDLETQKQYQENVSSVGHSVSEFIQDIPDLESL